MRYKVAFTKRAERDLNGIYNFIAENSGEATAARFVGRVEAYCLGFVNFPARGTRRDDLLPGLRMVGFEHRLSIGFRVLKDRVVFHRFLYGGRQFGFSSETDG